MQNLEEKIKTYYSKASRYVSKEIIPPTKKCLLELRDITLEFGDFVFDHRPQIWLGIQIIGGIVIFAFAPAIFVALLVLRFFFNGTKNNKCPKCDSTNLNQVRPSRWSRYMAAGIAPWGSPPKTLIVCRDCGFSWKDQSFN